MNSVILDNLEMAYRHNSHAKIGLCLDLLNILEKNNNKHYKDVINSIRYKQIVEKINKSVDDEINRNKELKG